LSHRRGHKSVRLNSGVRPAMQHPRQLTVKAGSWFCLVVSAFSCILVLERLSAALWQWYKFRDFGGGGHITLSQSTAALACACLAVLIAASLLVWRVARSDSAIRPAARSLLAAALALGCAAAYLGLGVSPLNDWRP